MTIILKITIYVKGNKRGTKAPILLSLGYWNQLTGQLDDEQNWCPQFD